MYITMEIAVYIEKGGKDVTTRWCPKFLGGRKTLQNEKDERIKIKDQET